MFRFDPTIQQLPGERTAIVYLAESSNQPNVAVPGRQAQAAQAFAVAVRSANDTISFYIALWLAVAREPLFYVYDRENVPLRALQEVANEAWGFCESMGFILDVVPLGERSPADQERILSRMRRDEGPSDPQELQSRRTDNNGAVGSTPTPAATHSPSPAELARLGRLLASF